VWLPTYIVGRGRQPVPAQGQVPGVVERCIVLQIVYTISLKKVTMKNPHLNWTRAVRRWWQQLRTWFERMGRALKRCWWRLSARSKDRTSSTRLRHMQRDAACHHYLTVTLMFLLASLVVFNGRVDGICRVRILRRSQIYNCNARLRVGSSPRPQPRSPSVTTWKRLLSIPR
jgi:hypothetical protein